MPISPQSQTFSQQVKLEMIERLLEHNEYWSEFLDFTLALIGRFMRREIIVCTKHKEYVDFLVNATTEVYGLDPLVQKSKRNYFVDFGKLAGAAVIRERNRNYEIDFEVASHDTKWTEMMLQALFLAGGMVYDTERTCNLQLNFTKRKIKSQIEKLLDFAQIEWRSYDRALGYRFGLKGSEPISEYFAKSGAHKALMKHENDRIVRNLNNTVNRMVNCDTANSNRLAQTAARQIEAIATLRQCGEFGKLDALTQEIAELREKHPGHSLSDLGELCLPPIGKAAVRNRLMKIINRAKQINVQLSDATEV